MRPAECSIALVVTLSGGLMSRQSYGRFCTGFAALIVVLGCGKQEQVEGSSKKADSTGASVQALAPAPVSAPTFTDANVLAKLDADNVADSSAGAMAATKGASAAVKEFGRMMMKEHHAMRVEGAALARNTGITPVMPAGDADAAAEAAVADSMRSMPMGVAWDRFFADHQAAGHTKVLQFAQEAVNHTQNAELKAMIQKAAPVVQKHLDKAKAIQGALGGGFGPIKAPM